MANTTKRTGLPCLSLLVVVAASSGFVSAQESSSTLEPTDGQEFIDPQEQISGGALLGAVFLAGATEIEPATIHALLAQDSVSELTLSINSIDGRYSGKWVYEPEVPLTGWVTLQIPTANSDFIKKYSIDELAALLTDADSNVYPLRWDGDRPTATVRLYVNTERAKSFFYDNVSGTRKLVYCEEASAKSGFKFNSVCDVSATVVASEPRVTIHRKFGVRVLEPISADVALTQDALPGSPGH